ncbi:MAG: hypothetical protein ACYCWW_12085, partial [Deltaproteobacteria bacterium]
ETSAQAAAQPAPVSPTPEAKKEAGPSARNIGGGIALAVGAAGIGVGVYGLIQRNAAVGNSNGANPAVRQIYAPEITQFTTVTIVGGSVAVVAIATGVYLLASGASGSEPSAPASGGLSIAPLPGGAMAAFAGSF